VALLWDGIELLIAENQSFAEKAERLEAAAAGLQERLPSVSISSTPYIEALSANAPESNVQPRLQRSQWLLEQPRTLYTIGADGEAGEVEVTGSCTYENEIYIAVEVGVERVNEVTATMNGTVAACYQHIGKNGRVFVFPLPKLSGKIQLDFLVDGQRYVVKTNIKSLI
jgi:hypothetical protein